MVGWVGNGWGLWVGGCFFWFGWDVAEGAVFVGDIGGGAEVVICPVTKEPQRYRMLQIRRQNQNLFHRAIVCHSINR
jgi:hypothetical protein